MTSRQRDLQPFLEATYCVDCDGAEIIALARSLTHKCTSESDKVLALYYYVRDAIRYNPYSFAPTAEAFKATSTLAAGEGWCVPKAVLLAALCRACGIPARLGFADVVNHLSTARMRAAMDTNIFYYHGYCSIYLNGAWVKSTPAFNLSLCEKFGLRPLEFDGVNDSLYHEYDQAGNRHMEYVRDRGEFVEVPLGDLFSNFRRHYPNLFDDGSAELSPTGLRAEQWEDDVAREKP